MSELEFEQIQPFENGQGDSGKSSRLKINRNFGLIKNKFNNLDIENKEIIDSIEKVRDSSSKEINQLEQEITKLAPSGVEALVSEERAARIEADKTKLNYKVLESIIETILNLLFPHQNGVNMDTLLDLSLFTSGDTIRIFLPGYYEQFGISVPENEFASNFVFFRKNTDNTWEKILIYKFNDSDFINN